MTIMLADNTVALSHAIDYLIFTTTQVRLKSEANPVELQGIFIDRENNIVTLKLEEGAELFNYSGTVTATTVYKNKKLIFDILVGTYNRDMRIIKCEIPKTGFLVDKRNRRRMNMDESSDILHAHITAETVNGVLSFNTETFCDFSINTISMRLDRRNGLLLPGDTVSEIVIRNHDAVVFQGVGEVIRIYNYNCAADGDSFVAIMRVLDPSERPKIDIHNNERRSGRISLLNANEGFIEFRHPFMNVNVYAKLYDLSNAGVSLLLNNDQYPLVAGMIIPDVSVQLPYRPRMSVTLSIRGVTEVANDDMASYRVAAEFVNPTTYITKEVSAFVQQGISSNLHDARPEDDHDLWEFYFETGFIYESKRRQLQQYTNEVRQTQMLLLRSGTPLLKKIVYKENGKILGNGTAIKIFDNTLMLQHLNAIKTHSGTAAKTIIRGMTTYFLDRYVNLRNDNRYVCTYYRPDNMFPSLVFGQTTNLINNEEICWLQKYQFCVRNSSLSVVSNTVSNIDIAEAAETDKIELEKLLISKKLYNSMRAEGLFKETLTDMKVFTEYAKLGLYRYRRIFYARDKQHNTVCFAVCTYASPGMNLSELTNSIKFYFNTDSSQKQLELMNSIMPLLIASYEHTQMKDPVILLDEKIPVPYGFKADKFYTMWVMDLYYPQLFKDYTDLIFNRLKDFIRMRKVVQ